jgi:hypothetical protein
MSPRRTFLLACLIVLAFASVAHAQQQPPPPSAARILLLPRKIVSGERATLAVLDLNGRLTPGVTVEFSNGDRFTTDQSGRALFVAPLDPGVIFGSIAGRSGHVPTLIISPAEAVSNSAKKSTPATTDSSPDSAEKAAPAAAATAAVTTAPRVTSLSDRFDIAGQGFCGDADANTVTIGGHRALVLAASPTSLIILPPTELDPGSAPVEISCGKNNIPKFSIIFLGLELHADSSPLAPGEHRQITVSIAGSSAKIALEAKNLAPDIAELTGGATVRTTSTGRPQNAAHFEVVGRRLGNFLISIRLVPVTARVTP